MRARVTTTVLSLILLVGSSAVAEVPEVIATFRATEPNTFFGWRIIPLGDQNDDGYDDIIIWGNPLRAFLFHGGVSPDTIPALVFDSVKAYISDLGDVNGDGYCDFSMQAHANFNYKLGLYYGGPSIDSLRDAWFGWDSLTAGTRTGYGTDLNRNGLKELATWVYPTQQGVMIFDLGPSPDSVPEFVLRPVLDPGDVFGQGLITGDFNGDGHTDLIASLRRHPQDSANGSLYVYWGGPLADTVPDMIIRRIGDFETGYNQFGDILVNLSDVSGDGYDDFYAGTGNSQDSVGFVYFGGPGIDTLPDVQIAENSVIARPAGDLNSDGLMDLATGLATPWSGSGWARIYYGGSPMDPIPDIVITNAEFPEWQTEFGTDCLGVGDFNGDGVDDFAISAQDIHYYWTVYILSGPGPASSVEIEYEPTLPSQFELRQNYPNPFNAETTIGFDLPRSGNVRLTVHNILGMEVTTLVNRKLSAGTHRVTWDGMDNKGRTAASSVYFYRLTADGINMTRKMVLLK